MATSPKVVVLGIDGACWDYIDPLLKAGQLPNLQQLLSSGVKGTLKSTLPPVTPMAWSCFISGKKPGKHGLFDFQVKIGEQFVPFSSTYRYGTSFWKYLNQSGYKVGIVGIPATYPPEIVDGFIISGFGTPSNSRKFTYPEELLDVIEQKHGPYQVVVPRQIATEQGARQYLKATLDNDAKQTQIALDLAQNYAVDLLAINFQSFDEFNHYTPTYTDIEAILQGIDQNFGYIRRMYPQANYVLLSDHGSRRLEGLFLIRNWLFEEGLLHVKPRPLNQVTNSEVNHILNSVLQQDYGVTGIPEKIVRTGLSQAYQRLSQANKHTMLNKLQAKSSRNFLYYSWTDEIDWYNTQIYELAGYGGFYINPKYKQEYQTIRQQFIGRLSTIRIPTTNEPLIQQIYTKEELFDGPFIDQAPDIIADFHESVYSFKEGGFVDELPKQTYFIDPLGYYGAHKQIGLFALNGPDIRPISGLAEQATIPDIPATILHLFDVPIPDDYDGRVLNQYITETFMAQTPIRTQTGDGELERTTDNPFTEDEMTDIEERLRDLGYM